MSPTRRLSTTTLPLLCLLLPACQSYYPVRVQVLDAETHQPIPRATLNDFYVTDLDATEVFLDLVFHYNPDPKRTSATTDAAGLAVLLISNQRARGRGAQAHAPGYRPSKAYINPARFDQLRHEHRREDQFPAAGQPDLTVQLRPVYDSPQRPGVPGSHPAGGIDH